MYMCVWGGGGGEGRGASEVIAYFCHEKKGGGGEGGKLFDEDNGADAAIKRVKGEGAQLYPPWPHYRKRALSRQYCIDSLNLNVSFQFLLQSSHTSSWFQQLMWITLIETGRGFQPTRTRRCRRRKWETLVQL